MPDLDPELRRAVTPAIGDGAGERRLVVVRIDAETPMGDAAAALHGRRLDDEQGRAGIGQHAEMDEMPVVGAAVVGAVLAHGRDDDAVCQLEAVEPDRREQMTGHEVSACGFATGGRR